MRTTSSGNHTPLEIAKTFRYSHLYEILAPVIRHPVPAKTLITLENALHELIEHEIHAAGLHVSVFFLSQRLHADNFELTGYLSLHHPVPRVICDDGNDLSCDILPNRRGGGAHSGESGMGPIHLFSAHGKLTNPTCSQGFFIQLDGRELVVRSCHENRKFRISEEGHVKRIEEGIVIGQPNIEGL